MIEKMRKNILGSVAIAAVARLVTGIMQQISASGRG